MRLRCDVGSRAVDMLFGAALGLALCGAFLLAAWDAARESRERLANCVTEACAVCRGGR